MWLVIICAMSPLFPGYTQTPDATSSRQWLHAEGIEHTVAGGFNLNHKKDVKPWHAVVPRPATTQALSLPPHKCQRPLDEQRWVFWCNCIRGSFAATLSIARHLDEQGVAVVGFICVAGSEGGNQPSQAKTIAQLWARFLPRQPDFEVLETKKPDGTWTKKGVDELVAKLRGTHVYAHLSRGPGSKWQCGLHGVCNVHHYMFNANRPGGDVALRISTAVPGPVPVVEYIVDPPRQTDLGASDMRAELSIPENATVIGRYGGFGTFDIRCVQEAVCRVAKSSRTDIIFLFANTKGFYSGCEKDAERIIRIPSMESSVNPNFLDCLTEYC